MLDFSDLGPFLELFGLASRLSFILTSFQCREHRSNHFSSVVRSKTMNTKRLYVLTAVNNSATALYQKLFLAFLLVALLFASIPLRSALAASGPTANSNLELEWKNKLRRLSAESLFYTQARFLPADFEDSAELARAWDLLHRHGAALRQANTIVLNHTGFDTRGRVTNEEQASESVHDLAEALRLMRAARTKIAEEGYKVQRQR
jgi:hypothetical protein